MKASDTIDTECGSPDGGHVPTGAFYFPVETVEQSRTFPATQAELIAEMQEWFCADPDLDAARVVHVDKIPRVSAS